MTNLTRQAELRKSALPMLPQLYAEIPEFYLDIVLPKFEKAQTQSNANRLTHAYLRDVRNCDSLMQQLQAEDAEEYAVTYLAATIARSKAASAWMQITAELRGKGFEVPH